MMIKTKSIFLIVSAFILTSCLAAGGTFFASQFRTNEINKQTFNLILYGMDSPHDVEIAAILDRTDDDILIEPASNFYSSSIYRDLTRDEAVEAAENFLKKSLWLHSSEYREITTPDGILIGYEIRPYFNPLQIDNSYYNCWYVIHSDNLVKFHVSYDRFREPFEHAGIH